MKTKLAGIMLSIAVLVACGFFLSLIHRITFGEQSQKNMRESPPPEGWDYWKQKEYREDRARFAKYSLFPVGMAAITILGAVRALGPRSRRTPYHVALGVVALIGGGATGCFLIWGLARPHGPPSDSLGALITWAFLAYFLGSIFTVFVAFRQIERLRGQRLRGQGSSFASCSTGVGLAVKSEKRP